MEWWQNTLSFLSAIRLEEMQPEELSSSPWLRAGALLMCAGVVLFVIQEVRRKMERAPVQTGARVRRVAFVGALIVAVIFLAITIGFMISEQRSSEYFNGSEGPSAVRSTLSTARAAVSSDGVTILYTGKGALEDCRIGLNGTNLPGEYFKPPFLSKASTVSSGVSVLFRYFDITNSEGVRFNYRERSVTYIALLCEWRSGFPSQVQFWGAPR